MDAEKPLNETEGEPPHPLTEQYYEDHQFASLSCPDAELRDIEFFQCRFDGCQFLRSGFRGCRFEQCVFERCDLSLLKVTDSRFIGVRFLKTQDAGDRLDGGGIAAFARLPGKQRQPFPLRGTQPSENGNGPMYCPRGGFHAHEPDESQPHGDRLPGQPIRGYEPELR